MGKSKSDKPKETPKLPRDVYEEELLRLQTQVVQMVEWVQQEGARVAVIFEGRDAAGKGGAIKRITEYAPSRAVRTVALPKPTERETTQWYFQRYIEHLPAAGEVVIFDRSWYNRAGVEKVLGFCTPEEHKLFLSQCPTFERMLVDDGIILIKYWFSVSEEEQERRFEARIDDPLKQWKLSTTDLESRTRWVDYSRAKDEMFVHTDIEPCRWNVVDPAIKRNARINCMAHLLSQVPWEPVKRKKVKMPPKQKDGGYQRTPEELQQFVPDHAAELLD